MNFSITYISTSISIPRHKEIVIPKIHSVILHRFKEMLLFLEASQNNKIATLLNNGRGQISFVFIFYWVFLGNYVFLKRLASQYYFTNKKKENRLK